MSELSLKMKRSIRLLARKIIEDLKKPKLVWVNGRYKMIPVKVPKLKLNLK